MKKIKIALILILTLSLLILVGCGGQTDNGGENPDNGGEESTPKKDITGVSFVSASFDYDGTEKSIVAIGIPSGVSASYESNKATNAGTYNAKVTLSGEGYNTLTLTATLTVNKADIEGITLIDNETVKADGEFHLPTVNGTLPAGVSAEWYFDDVKSNAGVKAVGTYNVRLVLSGINHNSITLTSVYKLSLDLAGLANTVIDAFGSTPDAWGFLPDSFGVDSLAVDSVPDYSDFVSVSSIPKNYIGKQMNVIFGVLNKCETALGYVNTVQSAFNVIAQAYQTFLNNSPDDYTTFSGNAGVFAYTLVISDEEYTISAELGSVAVKLFANIDDNSYGARIQLTDTTVLKYNVENTQLTVALNILNTSSTYVQFVRDDENPEIVTGCMYEYISALGKELVATSALISVGEDYTTVVGTKGDFIPTANARNCEVYDNATGRLVGTEVSEILGENEDKSYDTLWYNIFDIIGITSIKKVDEQNVLNPDKIYINGSSDTIHTKIVSVLPLDTSRRFDIEFKTVCAYKYNTEKEEYELVEFEVPMLFIQEKCEDDFEDDFADENGVAVIINKTSADRTAVNEGYHILVEAYNIIKDAVTQEDIITYCAVN